MTNHDLIHRYMLERIYEKLLNKDRSRTIKYENIKDVDRDFSIRQFNELFRELADMNYAFSKPKTDTWFLVEDNPKDYAEVFDVSEDRVNRLEENYGRKEIEPKGVVKKGSMEEKM